ncbi:MAG: hypothetical protein V3T86_10160 [Planctomycetota bacterium]
MTRRELEDSHVARFRKLARFVRERSPYYARVMKERGIDPDRCLPRDFPVLTKNEVIENFDEISTDPRVRTDRIAKFLTGSRDARELMDGRFRVLHTSGTSGTVCYSVFDPTEWMQGVMVLERILRAALPPRRVAFIGATQGHFAGVSFAVSPAHWIRGLFYRTRVFDINDPTEKIVAGLNEFKPFAFSGYSGAISMLADQRLAGNLTFSPTRILVGGEPMADRERKRVAGVFGTDVRLNYASSEHLFMGFDLMHGPGMYLLEENLIFELQTDHILVTNLYRKTVPLIRYRMDDVLPVASRGATWGPYTVVDKVLGRSEEAPVFLNEKGVEDYIHPIVIVEFFVANVKSFQMRLVNKSQFRFHVVLESGLTDAQADAAEAATVMRLKELLAQKNMGNVVFEVVRERALPVDRKTGKFRLIVKAAS